VATHTQLGRTTNAGAGTASSQCWDVPCPGAGRAVDQCLGGAWFSGCLRRRVLARRPAIGPLRLLCADSLLSSVVSRPSDRACVRAAGMMPHLPKCGIIERASAGLRLGFSRACSVALQRHDGGCPTSSSARINGLTFLVPDCGKPLSDPSCRPPQAGNLLHRRSGRVAQAFCLCLDLPQQELLGPQPSRGCREG